MQLQERVRRRWDRSEYPERLNLTIAWNELLRAERLQQMRDVEQSNQRGVEGTVVVVVVVVGGNLCPGCRHVMDWMQSWPEN